MSYARARLWLGITGVGTLVIISVAFIITGVPHRIFPSSEVFRVSDVTSLLAFLAGFSLLMLPLDFLGGWVVPRAFNRPEAAPALSLPRFAAQWTRGVLAQSLVYLTVSLAILTAGRATGIIGAVAVVLTVSCAFLVTQSLLARLLARRLREVPSPFPPRVMELLLAWGFAPKRTIIVDHADTGFTGGIMGWPGNESLIIPRQWLSLSPEQLAAVVARRLAAIESGSRTGGVLVALVWIVAGFYLSSLLGGAGVQNVAGLITLYCGFTLWSLLGLLTLPTLSRLSSLSLDRHVTARGVAQEYLKSALILLDLWQDDEPDRSPLIETIFHPVPSLSHRVVSQRSPAIGAWHAARMTLFLSWACAGLLSRAVHCNVGRPELWVMLPTD